MEQSAIRKILKDLGWQEDNYGHMKKTMKDRLYRVKFQATSLRLERQFTVPASDYSPAKNEWGKIVSNYFKNITPGTAGGIFIPVSASAPTSTARQGYTLR